MIPVGAPGTATQATARLRRVEEAMDARVMGPRIRSAIGGTGSLRCHVVDAKYEPGVRCTVLYRVDDRFVRGDLLDDPVDRTDPSRPVVDPGVRLACFPDDPDLPRLRDVADPAVLGDALREAVPLRGRVLRCRTELLRYRPAKRATLAVEVRGGGEPAAQRFVVKSYHDGRKAAAVAAEAVLLAGTLDPAEPLRFAPVRAHLPQLSAVLQGRVHGVGLDEVIRTPGPAAVDAVRRAAAALAALHRRPVVSRRERNVGAEVARFLVRGGRVAEVDPVAGSALVGLASRLAATAEDVPAGAVGLVHGDCKPSQFLLRGERDVVLLDLDSCGQADPAADVGTFLATLRQHGLREIGARRARPSDALSRATLSDVFLGAYVEQVAGAADGELCRRIAWYEAVALERKALRCFARAPRSPLTRALVEHGHGCLDRLGGIR